MFMLAGFLMFFITTAIAGAPSAEELVPRRPAGTFSIVARDPATGEFGQSHWFSVGSSVSWGEAGVGAVATQSFIEPAYGPHGLALMKAGKSAKDALDELLSKDEARDVRQVAFIDAQGRVAAHTGKMCIPFTGDRIGRDHSAQGNLLASSEVWENMGRTFEQTKGDLGDRILAALRAGQEAGGDVRGRQSAAHSWFAPSPRTSRGKTVWLICESKITRRRSRSSHGCTSLERPTISRPTATTI